MANYSGICQPQRAANVWRLLICTASLAIALPAHSHNFKNTAKIAKGHITGHTHDHAHIQWPPTPEGADKIKPLHDPINYDRAENEKKRQDKLTEGRAFNKWEVKKALGKRYARSAIIENDDSKSEGGQKQQQLVYFSASNNTTVNVTVENDQVVSVKNQAPSEYQPEITDEEQLVAEKIARDYFLAQGEKRINQLQGFGILSYLPVGKGFHNTRVIYISFHINSDAPPELAAWVDISNGKVIRTRKEHL